MAKQFGSWEKKIARWLSSFPVLKKNVKSAYSLLMFIVYRKQKKIYTSHLVEPAVGFSGETFYGYFDKSPVSAKGDLLLHRFPEGIHKKNCVEICVYPGGENVSPRLVLHSQAFNWQQGARLLWLNDEHFVFNDVLNDSYVAKVYSVIDGALKREYEYPVQEVYGYSYYLSINYKRLSSLAPDYGYKALPKLNDGELKEIKHDGITYVSFDTGESRLLYSLEDVCNVERRDYFATALHSVNHVTCSPNGERFFFIHRFYYNSKRCDRLMLGAVNASPLEVLSGVGVASHFCWLDDDTIFGYMMDEARSAGFYTFHLGANSWEYHEWISELGIGDGHPVNVGGGNVVIDSYPDRSRMQQLYLLDLSGKTAELLGEFYHGFSFSGDSRCDLHPRLDLKKNEIYFDSVFDGVRRMYRMKLNGA